jgi:hypothetical protein
MVRDWARKGHGNEATAVDVDCKNARTVKYARLIIQGAMSTYEGLTVRNYELRDPRPKDQPEPRDG